MGGCAAIRRWKLTRCRQSVSQQGCNARTINGWQEINHLPWYGIGTERSCGVCVTLAVQTPLGSWDLLLWVFAGVPGSWSLALLWGRSGTVWNQSGPASDCTHGFTGEPWHGRGMAELTARGFLVLFAFWNWDFQSWLWRYLCITFV